MSPEVLKNYKAYTDDDIYKVLVYDPFFSEVYSLGHVILRLVIFLK